MILHCTEVFPEGMQSLAKLADGKEGMSLAFSLSMWAETYTSWIKKHGAEIKMVDAGKNSGYKMCGLPAIIDIRIHNDTAELRNAESLVVGLLIYDRPGTK